MGAFDSLLRGLEDAQVLLELAAEAHDAATAREAEDALPRLEADLVLLERVRLLTGAHDRAHCFIDITAGTGGTDALDWVSMLGRMYLRYGERRDWAVEAYRAQPGEETGCESLTLLISSDFAHGYLQAQVGVHQLERISPFEAGAPRKTARAWVDVSPVADDLPIPETDVELTFLRSAGHGGQRVNTLLNKAILRHLPTGLVVTCDTERLPAANKDMAFKLLRARLRARELKERVSAEPARPTDPPIRTYVLAPHRRVTDARTGVETDDVDAVLDGALDPFISAWLVKDRT